MKKYLFIALLFVFQAAAAQSFEGTVTWKVDIQITDPHVKAQMEQAKQMMNDPEKKKQFEAQMNNPQMKALMEKNPQLKAQMDNLMKSMRSGDFMSMFPKSITVNVKGGNYLSSMSGGFMSNTETLHLVEKNVTYQLDKSAKTYSVLHPADKSGVKNIDVSVVKTKDMAKVLGYNCTKYIVIIKPKDTTGKEKVITENVWATTEIKGLNLSALSGQELVPQAAAISKQIDGVPLKVEMNIPQGHMNMEAAELKKATLPASMFVIPAGYKLVGSTI